MVTRQKQREGFSTKNKFGSFCEEVQQYLKNPFEL